MKDNEPKDICCICSRVSEYGTMQDVNEVDFELLCDDCKDCRCVNCNWIRSKMKFDMPRFFCRHRGMIQNPKEKVCDHYEPQDEKYSAQASLADYVGGEENAKKWNEQHPPIPTE